MVELSQLHEPTHTITWCPGCGNFSILAALKKAIVDCNLEPHNTVIVSGIGCGGKIPHFIKTYGFESLHGRALAAASGIKLANHKLEVIVVGGDGDGYGIGANHFIHASRRNYDMTYIVQNNQIYGLTTGQASPTSEKSMKTKSTPFGVIEQPINPIALALAAGATFIARGFSGDLTHLSNLISQGIKHKGFAFIDVFQPCVIWNHINTFEYFRKKCYKLEQTDYKPNDKFEAFRKAFETDKLPIGVFYQEQRPTYEDELPQLSTSPLVKQPIDNIDIQKTLEKYL
ncbi:MAG: thiamine pyrophosphate-dependent enzyme [Candidatus Micrarchaeota archaeon]|nr:thiamine pyrophosphate-dependent enzyme [Candidatus Micrarchaeota archaeon]